MATSLNQLSPNRLTIIFVILFSILLAPFVGYWVASTDVSLVSLVIFACLVGLWVIFAGSYWWVLFPASTAFGGVFYVGFKIYPHEMILVICFLPLVLMVAMKGVKMQTQRQKPPISAFILISYLLVHWTASLIYNSVTGLAGHGNVSRIYLQAVWPLLLFTAYYYYGDSRHLRLALGFMYVAAVLRTFFGLLGYFLPTFLYIPGINFVLPTYNTDDLRASALMLALIAISYFSLSRFFLTKWFHFLIYLGANVALFFGGGRIASVVLAGLALAWLLLYQRYFTLICVLAAMAGFVAFVNLNPSFIEQFPPKVERTLSVLILKEGRVEMQDKLEASNQWHQLLGEAGFKRWLETPLSIFFGHGVRPFDKSMWEVNLGPEESFYFNLQVAAKTGSYEAGLWTILATIGLVGLLLYANVFIFLFKSIVPIIYREKIRSHAHAVGFMATYLFFIWVIFCWTLGHFPSMEMMLALFAKTSLDDQKQTVIKTAHN